MSEPKPVDEVIRLRLEGRDRWASEHDRYDKAQAELRSPWSPRFTPRRPSKALLPSA